MLRDGKDEPYLHCEECEWTWDDPSKISDMSSGRLGIDFDSENASSAAIKASGWEQFAVNEGE